MTPEAIDETWINVLRIWAASEPLIEAAYVFGSRVKGTHRTDSDLDVAVIVAGADDSERLGHDIFQVPRWTARLQPLLPITLHLQCAMDDDVVVMPAVRDHGRLVYSADR